MIPECLAAGTRSHEDSDPGPDVEPEPGEIVAGLVRVRCGGGDGVRPKRQGSRPMIAAAAVATGAAEDATAAAAASGPGSGS